MQYTAPKKFLEERPVEGDGAEQVPLVVLAMLLLTSPYCDSGGPFILINPLCVTCDCCAHALSGRT